MRKINFSNIWDKINDESRQSPNSLIARKIPSISKESVFIASDFNNNIRCLFIDLSSVKYLNTGKLPLFKGLEINEMELTIGDCKQRRFLRISQTIPNTENIFELFISDICKDIIDLQTFSLLEKTIFRSLSEWKLFFERYPTEFLSISSQMGLYGELTFLEKILFPRYPFYESIQYWTGAKRTNHDFQFNNIAVEIKTTASKEHTKIHISSERQLDKTGLNKLFLILYHINTHENDTETSLSSTVSRIRSLLSDDLIALDAFNTQLIRCGYYDDFSKLYTLGFSSSKCNIFEVCEDFPSITTQTIPNGIGDLKYTIMVSACVHFEISESDFVKYI
ncbi:MAG: hypothetical protein CVT93_05145 [Bacteroidetes bacterium HGW-Bacteroidetes-10]|nr:MAG: hypothetical protein CVT93_05145 [Bacteroidetes bacterium HGW-Bacteroidetes-10]